MRAVAVLIASWIAAIVVGTVFGAALGLVLNNAVAMWWGR